jgi:hypothetical protein
MDTSKNKINKNDKIDNDKTQNKEKDENLKLEVEKTENKAEEPQKDENPEVKPKRKLKYIINGLMLLITVIAIFFTTEMIIFINAGHLSVMDVNSKEDLNYAIDNKYQNLKFTDIECYHFNDDSGSIYGIFSIPIPLQNLKIVYIILFLVLKIIQMIIYIYLQLKRVRIMKIVLFFQVLQGYLN